MTKVNQSNKPQVNQQLIKLKVNPHWLTGLLYCDWRSRPFPVSMTASFVFRSIFISSLKTSGPSVKFLLATSFSLFISFHIYGHVFNCIVFTPCDLGHESSLFFLAVVNPAGLSFQLSVLSACITTATKKWTFTNCVQLWQQERSLFISWTTNRQSTDHTDVKALINFRSKKTEIKKNVMVLDWFLSIVKYTNASSYKDVYYNKAFEPQSTITYSEYKCCFTNITNKI